MIRPRLNPSNSCAAMCRSLSSKALCGYRVRSRWTAIETRTVPLSFNARWIRSASGLVTTPRRDCSLSLVGVEDRTEQRQLCN